MDKKIKAIVAAGGAAALVAANAIKAKKFVPEKKEVKKLPNEVINVDRYRKNLSDAIKIKTISHVDEEKIDWSEFERFRDFLAERYPLVHKNLTREIVPPSNLIFHWKGKNSSLDPIALLSHQDVVPVTEGTEKDWVHPAFSGHDDGEFIWGRGALDMKNHLIAVMEAIEALLEEGFEPVRDVYLLFGDNEEIVAGKNNGAKAIMETLRARGVHLDCIIDEGGAALDVNVKGVLENKFIAGIGIAEKGYADIEIVVNAKGGHSSQPPAHTALGIMADVIKDLESNQFKATFTETMSSLLDKATRNMTYPVRFFACNLSYIKPVLLEVAKLFPPSACMVRTTTAVTQAEGSPAANVLPQRAAINVNFRAMPGVTTADIISHIRKVVRYKDIEIKVKESKLASKVSPTDSRSFGIIEELCLAINPNSVVVPFLVMGGTDAYNYEPICENIYRYAPFVVDTRLLLACHGTNEKIPVETLGNAVKFFKNFVKRASDE